MTVTEESRGSELRRLLSRSCVQASKKLQTNQRALQVEALEWSSRGMCQTFVEKNANKTLKPEAAEEAVGSSAPLGDGAAGSPARIGVGD